MGQGVGTSGAGGDTALSDSDDQPGMGSSAGASRNERGHDSGRRRTPAQRENSSTVDAPLSLRSLASEPEEELSPEASDESLDVFGRSSFAQMRAGRLKADYQTLDELGAGGFGVVKRARHRRSGGVVALKTIPVSKVKDPHKVKAEFNIIRQLDHPHICKAYECYEDRRNMYLVMELLTGGTLLEAICRQTKFTESDASHIMRQILSALSYLHEANLIFRDLKTENVMFRGDAGRTSESGGPAQRLLKRDIKLIDFGLCCPLEGGSKLCQAAGTPYSVAPELVTTPVQYDQKCDAWSAGVVMHIMLSGKHPFTGKTKKDLFQSIRSQPCNLESAVWKRISKQAKALLAKLLRKASDQRLGVSEALQHPWLSKQSEVLDQNIMEDVVGSLKHFQSLSIFQKAAVTALAWRASDEDTARLRSIFTALDRDGNGHITIAELRNAIEASGVGISADVELLAKADTNGSDTIEYTEFLAAALDKKKALKEDVIWEAFRIFDQDGNGRITKGELLKALVGRTGDQIRQVHGSQAVERALSRYDVTCDDGIDFDEFLNMISSTYEGRPVWRQEGAEVLPVRSGRVTSEASGAAAIAESSMLGGLFSCTCMTVARPAAIHAKSGRSRAARAAR